MDPFIAIFLLGVLALVVAAVAFVSDIVVWWWVRWDMCRRRKRRADVRELKRVLDLP